jgi:hypothetical protein
MTSSAAFREHLRRSLAWQDAHAGFDKAVDGFPPHLRGAVVKGFPHSAWQLLEHLRLAQFDILDFSRNPNYHELKWPDDYWPKSPEPPSESAWDDSVAAFKKDRAEMQALAADESIDLFAKIPHGSGQTVLREILLVVDHNAFHVGQLVMLRQLLDAWG